MKILRKFLVSLCLIVMTAGVANAELQLPSDSGKGNVYLEFAVPKEWIKDFGLHKGSEIYPDDEHKKINNGIGSIEFGFKPLAGSINLEDSFGKRLFKNMIISMDYTFNAGDKSVFKDYLYTVEERVTSDGSCYDTDVEGYEYWNGRCYECSAYNDLCTDKDVFGRDAYIKYSDKSFAIGVSFPVEIAKRIELEGGLVFRLHGVKEGWQTDELKKYLEPTLAAKAKLSLNLDKKGTFAFTAAGERSVLGDFKYWKGQVGGRVRFGGKN